MKREAWEAGKGVPKKRRFVERFLKSVAVQGDSFAGRRHGGIPSKGHSRCTPAKQGRIIYGFMAIKIKFFYAKDASVGSFL